MVPTVWWWCAVEVMFLICKYLHRSSIIEFLYSVPMSVIGPYFRIKSSNTTFATVFALLFCIGIATRYLVKSQMSVTAYSIPLLDFGSGPIVFTITISKALCGVSVIVSGVLVCLVVFDFCHLGHFFMSLDIFFQ